MIGARYPGVGLSDPELEVDWVKLLQSEMREPKLEKGTWRQ